MRLRTRTAVVLCFIVVLVGGYLIYEQLMSSVSPYTSVSELVKDPKEYFGHKVQLMGVVKEGSVERAGANLTFVLVDENFSLTVLFQGSFPSGFGEGRSVVVIGMLTSDLMIQAEKILVKCPSKYEEPPRTSNRRVGFDR